MYQSDLSTIKLMISKKTDQNYYKSITAINILEKTPDLLTAFENYQTNTQGEALLLIFGLLQNLFVSIDALYDLCRAQMHYKYSINVNQNETLRKLKHIRNDIVGHPTHRTYQQGGIGFSIIDFSKTTKTDIYYQTYIFKKSEKKEQQNHIQTNILINEYLIETQKIISEIKHHLSNPKQNKQLAIRCYQLYEHVLKKELNVSLLTDIKTMFVKLKNIQDNSLNRFLWRIKLLNKLFTWQENTQEFSRLIETITEFQTIKLYQMACEINDIKAQPIKLRKNDLLDAFVAFKNKSPQVSKYLNSLHDQSHLYFKSDLEELILIAKKETQVLNLLKFLASQEDSDKIFLIGSIIQRYTKYNS